MTQEMENVMSKELEALKRLRQETCPATYMADFDKNECCDVIEQALQRLEAIDNANPSEALESLEEIRDFRYGKEKLLVCQTQMYTTIKQALLKAQEQEKVLEIIKEKGVDVSLIKKYDFVEDYNSAVWIAGRPKLVKEEFNTLKEVLE